MSESIPRSAGPTGRTARSRRRPAGPIRRRAFRRRPPRAIPGAPINAASTAAGHTFSPPVMIRSPRLPCTISRPSSSSSPRSPVGEPTVDQRRARHRDSNAAASGSGCGSHRPTSTRTSTPSSGRPSYTTPLPVSVMPYVVTTLSGSASRRLRATEHDPAEQARVDTPQRGRHQRDQGRAVSAPPATPPPRRTRRAPSERVPDASARVTTDNPPTCDSGRQASHVSSPVTARRADVAVADAATASWVSTTPRGVPVVPLVATTSASPSSTPRPSSSCMPCSVDQSVGVDRIEQSHGERQAAGDDRAGTLRRRRPISAAERRRIGRRRGGRSQRGAARSEGYGDGRESVDTRRSTAHTPGRGRARGDRCRRRGRRARRRCGGGSVLRLIVSLALQIGVNYANDYSDGVRGTDDVRVGPARLVAGGLAEPQPCETGSVRCVRCRRRCRAGAGAWPRRGG